MQTIGKNGLALCPGGFLLSISMIPLLLLGCDTSNRTMPDPVVEGFEFLFVQDSVSTIKLSPWDKWAAMKEAYLASGDNAYRKASFEFKGEELAPVGLRLTDSAGERYALKLNFDYFGSTRFHEIDRVFLEIHDGDPSSMRERLASRMYRAMDVPAARTAFVSVEGEEELGLYVMVQDVDKRFLKDLFGRQDHADDGNLYECRPPGCSLAWEGSSKEDYVVTDAVTGKQTGLVLATNEEDPALNDYADLTHFLDVLNNTPDDEFEAELPEVFHVDTFLRWLAVAVVISDYDSYLGSADNFFLYRRPDTERFVFIPWDLDRSYGVPYGVESSPCYDNPAHGAFDPPWCSFECCGLIDRPLAERILAAPSFKAAYVGYVRQVVDQYLTPAKQEKWIQEFDGLIGGKAASGPDALYSTDEYRDAISGKKSDGDVMNLLEFVKLRHAFLQKELPAR